MKLLIDFRYKMPHLFLFLGVTWTLYRPTSPLSTTKPTLATPNEDIEFEYSDDAESPGQINKPDSGEQKLPVMMPYFEHNNTVVYAKLNESLELDCPVKNYSNSQHAIMWYKENLPISNGNQALQDIYELEKNFNLTIKLISNETIGNYSCNVVPLHVRRHITVKFEDVESMKVAGSATTSSGFILLLSLPILAALLSLNIRRDVFMLNY